MKRVKTIFAGLCFCTLSLFALSSNTALAVDKVVNFECDANTEPDLVGYKLYQSDISNGQVREVDGGTPVLVIPAAKDSSGIETFSITISDGIEPFWKLTAYDSAGNESDFSNETNMTPGVPGGYKIKSVQIIVAP